MELEQENMRKKVLQNIADAKAAILAIYGGEENDKEEADSKEEEHGDKVVDEDAENEREDKEREKEAKKKYMDKQNVALYLQRIPLDEYLLYFTFMQTPFYQLPELAL